MLKKITRQAPSWFFTPFTPLTAYSCKHQSPDVALNKRHFKAAEVYHLHEMTNYSFSQRITKKQDTNHHVVNQVTREKQRAFKSYARRIFSHKKPSFREREIHL